MEDKIEVGEYVRTKDGIIDKVDALCGMIENAVHLENQKWFDIKNIVKHSKQLIDLIEVEDIVNDCIVMSFGYECVNGNKEKSILVEGKYTKVNYALLDFDIKTILTKESYIANCYKVGGEE